ncbi:hypothetical protein IMZ48_30300 [Candidatus Bathyarchaeota archaeon]|nr:hypothetical protein [Candidatus Bathyarchaeota archaeon]
MAKAIRSYKTLPRSDQGLDFAKVGFLQFPVRPHPSQYSTWSPSTLPRKAQAHRRLAYEYFHHITRRRLHNNTLPPPLRADLNHRLYLVPHDGGCQRVLFCCSSSAGGTHNHPIKD